MIILPMLASDAVLEKIQFPVYEQPKIDGVRALNKNGNLLSRSLESHDNRFVTQFFSLPELNGLDGEMVAEDARHPRLCSLTTSALSTIGGTPYTLWWLFDLINAETCTMDYQDRYVKLQQYLTTLTQTLPHVAERLRVIRCTLVHNLEELLERHKSNVRAGYEGTIVRDPRGKYKSGRSTVKEGGLLRIKPFDDCEILITGVIEGKTNLNEATISATGKTKRSTHAANKVDNGKVGTILGRLLQDIVVNNGERTLPKDTPVRVSPGRMTAEEREKYLAHPELIVGRIGKVQHFPKGVKDTLRMATFQSLRSPVDL